MATENLAPQVISRLLGEIRDLVRHSVDGIEYVDSDSDTVSEIHAMISGPGKAVTFVVVEGVFIYVLMLQRALLTLEESSV
jgi:hypothetical protein